MTGNIDWAAAAIGVTVLGSIISFAFFIGRLSTSKVDKADCEQRRRECMDNSEAAKCRMWSELNTVRIEMAKDNATFKTEIGNLKSVTGRLEKVAVKINGG